MTDDYYYIEEIQNVLHDRLSLWKRKLSLIRVCENETMNERGSK